MALEEYNLDPVGWINGSNWSILALQPISVNLLCTGSMDETHIPSTPPYLMQIEKHVLGCIMADSSTLFSF